ncbi:hypothetical protein NM688_g3659 [Phlebia brevispora]|uniref:Uncharacterized protein n=1 Tax=Phlebia brevispora TaxID=194682 RepID=A0ACC1T4X1_9APHY|nr:hypothetical protein NM688_g3659 [Phlebia brevispora]
MSSSTPNSVLVAIYEADLWMNYCTIAALALVLYELMITFRYEFEFIWYRKCLCCTGFALQCSSKCEDRPLNFFLYVLYETPKFILAVFSALRVAALLDQAYAAAVSVLMLGLAPIALILYLSSQGTTIYVDDPVLGPSCYFNYLISPSIVFYSAAASDAISATLGISGETESVKTTSMQTVGKLTWLICSVDLIGTLCIVVADIIAIVVTWIKTRKQARLASAIDMKIPFSAMLLQYGKTPSHLFVHPQLSGLFATGTLFFIILTTIAFLDTLLLLVPSFPEANPLSVILVPLPSIVVSRFLISLRQASTAEVSDVGNSSAVSVLDFRVPSFDSLIGNLGEPFADSEEDFDSAGRVNEYSNATSSSRGDEETLYRIVTR